MPSDAAAKGVKLERYASGGALLLRRVASGKFVSASSHLLFRATVLATLALVFLFALHYPSLLSRSFSLASADGASSSSSSAPSRSHRSLLASSSAAATSESQSQDSGATVRPGGSKSSGSASSARSIPELYEERGASSLREFGLRELHAATSDFRRLL